MISITPSIAHLNHTVNPRFKEARRSTPGGRQRRDTMIRTMPDDLSKLRPPILTPSGSRWRVPSCSMDVGHGSSRLTV